MNGNSGSIVYTIRGPVMLITVGALFALNNFTQYGFNSTWPVILIVFGLLTLLGRGTSQAPPAPPRYGPGMPGPYNAEPGGYRQSSYTQPPAGAPPAGPTAKGGFGTMAPPRTGEQGQAPPSVSGGEA